MSAEIIPLVEPDILAIARRVSAFLQDPASPPAMVAEIRDLLRLPEYHRGYADGYTDAAGPAEVRPVARRRHLHIAASS